MRGKELLSEKRQCVAVAATHLSQPLTDLEYRLLQRIINL